MRKVGAILRWMDCPTCGLVNPPEASNCDCGYDFEAAHPPETLGWPITLAWSQKVAAYWSISWPAWLASHFSVILLQNAYSIQDRFNWIVATATFFGIQCILTQRIVRKNYRSFRVGVHRDDDRPSRKLTVGEASLVWLWILGPQLAFFLAVSLLIGLYGAKIPPEIGGGIPSWSRLLQFLVVGPYAVDLALRVKYQGFRLQPYGYRFR